MAVASLLLATLPMSLLSHRDAIVVGAASFGSFATAICAHASPWTAYGCLGVIGLAHVALVANVLLTVCERASGLETAAAVVVGAFALKSCILPAVQALPGAGLPCCAAMPGLAAICYLAGNRVGKDAVAPADTASARKPTMGGDRTSALFLAFDATFVRSPQDVTLRFFPSLSVSCIAYALLRLHLLGLVGVQDGYGEWFF